VATRPPLPAPRPTLHSPHFPLHAPRSMLLVALGAEVNEGAGSHVWVTLKGVRAVFHRPHPEQEAGKLMVRSVRDFLENAGVRP
jgi:hypothetical protein